MVDIQTVSIAIASASVVAGVIYYALHLFCQVLNKRGDIQSVMTGRTVEVYAGSEEKLDPPPGGSYADYDVHPCLEKY